MTEDVAPTGWQPSKDDPLLILAMDHRASFGETLFGVKDDKPTPSQTAAMEKAKRLIYEGLLQGVPRLGRGRGGVLVDQELGQAVIEQASDGPVVLAVPIEASGHPWFQLQYGDAWLARLQESDAQYGKVLVRDNPDFDPDHRAAQWQRLATVSRALHDARIPLVLELLVPATDAQLAAAGGSHDAYDRDARPALVVRVIADLQAANVEPALWKIEGLETTDAAEQVVRQVRAGGSAAQVIVLGRDAPDDRLDHWLDVAAPVDGFVGFAIGRSIWEEAVRAHEQGTLDDAGTTAAVAAKYVTFAQRYLDAAGI